VHIIRQSLLVVLDAFYRFDRDDRWAIASHIALSILMSVFPFLIVVTAIAAFIGSVNPANEVARLLYSPPGRTRSRARSRPKSIMC
jgi:membrane protein